MHLWIFSTSPVEHDLAVAENAIATLNKTDKPHKQMLCFPCMGTGKIKGQVCWHCEGAKVKQLPSISHATSRT